MNLTDHLGFISNIFFSLVLVLFFEKNFFFLFLSLVLSTSSEKVFFSIRVKYYEIIFIIGIKKTLALSEGSADHALNHVEP